MGHNPGVPDDPDVRDDPDARDHAATRPVDPWDQGAGSAHDVALEVLLRGPLSRSDLARRLDLSAPTLSRLTKDLLRSDVFTETPSQVDPTTGRPTRPLDIVAESRLFVGVCLTAHQASAVRTTIRAEVGVSAAVPLRGTSPAQVIDAVVELVQQLGRASVIRAVGVSLGGLVAQGRIVERAPFYAWETPVTLADQLESRLGTPVVVDNDVAALARLHAWFGVGQQVPDFCLLTLGIATGYALVRDRQVVTTADSGLGLIGHLPLDPVGPTCPDGHRGCAQAMLSIAAISSSISVSAGRWLAYGEGLELAAEGHPGARQVIRDSARALGRRIATIAATTAIEYIVLAGTAIDLATADRPGIDIGIAEIRTPGARDLHLEIEPNTSAPWARGAATSAIRSYVLPN
jgi:predicted NBD/HSP70 family sugar kinase